MKNAFDLLREIRMTVDSVETHSSQDIIRLLRSAEEAIISLFLLAVADKDVQIIFDLSRAIQDAYAENTDKALDVLFCDHPRLMYHVGTLHALMVTLFRFWDSWGTEVEARTFLASKGSARMRYVLFHYARKEPITYSRLNRLLRLDPVGDRDVFEEQHTNLRLLARAGFATTGMQSDNGETGSLQGNYMLTCEGADAIRSTLGRKTKR